jgi:hypothetical protein
MTVRSAGFGTSRSHYGVIETKKVIAKLRGQCRIRSTPNNKAVEPCLFSGLEIRKLVMGLHQWANIIR